MSQVNFPSDYQQVMPYLIVKDAAGFLQFMKDVLGATEKMKNMRGDTIAHGEALIGKSVIMFTEASETFGPDNAAMFVYVADADAAYEKALQAGAISLMPMSDQPYGRTCGVKDPFGNTWWITTYTA